MNGFISQYRHVMIQMFAGGILLYSGLLHCSHPLFFAHNMAAYRILPESSLVVLTLFVPALQTVVGFVLLFSLPGYVNAAWNAALGLYSCFVVFQAKIILSGEQISCGCFGFSSEPVSLKTIALPLVIALILWFGKSGLNRTHKAIPANAA